MTGFIVAVALFGALAALIVTLRADEPADSFADAPRRLPAAGTRDVHAVASGTLGRAYVPSWG